MISARLATKAGTTIRAAIITHAAADTACSAVIRTSTSTRPPMLPAPAVPATPAASLPAVIGFTLNWWRIRTGSVTSCAD